MLALLSPVVVAFFFRFVGDLKGDRMLGVEAVAAFLLCGTLTGLLMAIFLDNSGMYA